MTAAEAYEAVIRPMMSLLPAPNHIRHDPEAKSRALEIYTRALEKYERPVLERAWQRVVESHELWCWPTVAQLRQAAVQAHRELQPAKDPEAWVEKAEAMSYSYTQRFLKTSAVAARAREGGYERELRDFVKAASWVQGQMIGGKECVGYDHAVLFGKGPRDKEAEQEWFAKARAQAETGHIRVHVPTAMVKRWQQEAEGRERRR
jgi:hypothetical protein